MSDQFEISANEAGVIRLFLLDLPAGQIDRFRDGDPDADVPTPLETALGCSGLDLEFVEVFPVSNLAGLGLAGYLVDGLGVAESDIVDDRAGLDDIDGVVVVILSNAFGGLPHIVTPQAPLRWIATYVEERAPVEFQPLPSQSAKGQAAGPAKSRPSDAAMSGRVAMVALLVLFALTAIMVWIAA